LKDAEAAVTALAAQRLEAARRENIRVAEARHDEARKELVQAVTESVLEIEGVTAELAALRSYQMTTHLPPDDLAARSWTSLTPPVPERTDFSSLDDATARLEARQAEAA